MELSIDLAGRRVLIVGAASPTRRVRARYLAAGATVVAVAGREGQADLAHSDCAEAGVQTAAFPTSEGEWGSLVETVEIVVVVDVSPAIDALVTTACALRSTWLTREAAAATGKTGRVILVGGGPGIESLLTVGALAALRDADVVYFDRLGPSDRLDIWAPGADLVDVGKYPGHHAIPQQEIERMLVADALAGKTVVRLKGGDPFVFGRGGEEVLACRAAGVPFTVIPGVTSAISVPAVAGIPVTHRAVSRLFTVISGHAPISDSDITHLIGLGGTVVVLMGMGTLQQFTAGLLRLGMRPDMPVAIVERGFAHDQRTTIGNLDTIGCIASAVGVESPAVLVVGNVVRLAEHGNGSAAALLREVVEMAV